MLFMFPGQGSQRIGMGKDICESFKSARNVFNEVDDAISFKLSDLIFHGSENELKATENAQPALMAVSMAFVRVLMEEFGIDVAKEAKFFAGHSLGEYTALCASGVISISEAAKILRVRGLAMAGAYPVGGAMAAVIGLNIEAIEQIVLDCCSSEEIVQIANDNSEEQIVISGHECAVKKAIEKAVLANARKVVLLEVSGPFHCRLMGKAVAKVAEILEKTNFKQPIKPIISNVTAKAEVNNFKELLVKQITERTKWRESILFAKSSSVSKSIEIGSGRVLTGLVKHISSDIDAININSLESMKNFAALYV